MFCNIRNINLKPYYLPRLNYFVIFLLFKYYYLYFLFYFFLNFISLLLNFKFYYYINFNLNNFKIILLTFLDHFHTPHHIFF